MLYHYFVLIRKTSHYVNILKLLHAYDICSSDVSVLLDI